MTARIFPPPLELITADMILSWNPCNKYPKEQIHKLCGDGLTARQIAELDIPIRDRIWILLQPKVIGEGMMIEAACVFAEHILPADCDARSRAGIEMARCWLRNEIDDRTLRVAYAVAYAAAYEAYMTASAMASAAAYAAAFAAASAAGDVAFTAADVAVYGAYAAYVATSTTDDGIAEEQYQLTWLIKHLPKKN